MKALRLLLDEMLDADVADRLRSSGHDVAEVADLGLAAADDNTVAARAIAEGRILVTLDEHFGDWVFLPLNRHPGVIRVKAAPATTANILSVVLPFLEEHRERDFANRLVIVRRAGVRWVRTDA